MKSDSTFLEEYEFLKNYVPEALSLSETSSPFDRISQFIDISNLQIVRLSDDFIQALFADEGRNGRAEAMIKEQVDLDDDDYVNLFLEAAFGTGLPSNVLTAIMELTGREAFGCYSAMHTNYKSSTTPWGIYLFPELIGLNVKALCKVFPDVSESKMIRFYTWAIYRHELFHFHCEHFATSQEVLQQKPYYLKYKQEVYNRLALTEGWLEEALAEDSVFNSRLIFYRSDLAAKKRKEIYRYDLRFMPPGYRDYECKKFGGPGNAHRILASQIVYGVNSLPIPTSINTIKKEYSQNDKKIPVYKVTGLKAKRIQ